MTETIERPGPPPNPDTAVFWAGLAEGHLLLQHCGSCDTVQHHPRAVCHRCWSSDLTWVESTGLGIIWTWTVVHRAGNPAWQSAVPYAVVIVELDEGPRIVTTYEGDLADPWIGERVRLKPRSSGSYTLTVAYPVDPTTVDRQ